MINQRYHPKYSHRYNLRFITTIELRSMGVFKFDHIFEHAKELNKLPKEYII